MKQLIKTTNPLKVYVSINGYIVRTYIKNYDRIFVNEDFNSTELYATFLKTFDNVKLFDDEKYGDNFTEY
jgi:hypothetical protein